MFLDFPFGLVKFGEPFHKQSSWAFFKEEEIFSPIVKVEIGPLYVWVVSFLSKL